MRVEDYTYELPDNLIADTPPEQRGASRLLVLDRKTGAIIDSYYRNVSEYLNEGDVLVINDTKVIVFAFPK